MSSERPRVEELGSDQAKAKPAPFAVTIVETPEQAEDAQSREAKSDQHEADDLAAQQKAADAGDRSAAAAEWQKSATIVQIVLGALGTGLLFWTLFLNSRASKDANIAAAASTRAANAAEKAYVADNRPWLNLTFRNASDYEPGKPLEVYFNVENLGKSAALDTRIWLKAVKVRRIQIDKSHVRRHVEECVKNAPINTFQSAVVLPTIKMATRQDAFTVEELDLANGNKFGYWLGLLCVCTYRSAVIDTPERFFHTTLTVLLKPDANKGLDPWIPDDLKRTLLAGSFTSEIITHVASIE